jgi:NitT/TauT family transport system substrate-binding protein
VLLSQRIARHFRRGVTALVVASLVWLAPAGAARAEPTTLEVAYIPILAMAQLFVIEGEGWSKEAGLELQLTRFSSGPAMVQALASGKFDIAYIGIGPALVARANGVDLKALAANGLGQGGVLGRGAFAAAFAAAKSPAEAFAEFHQSQGRAVKLATLPPGSVPDTTLHYYLFEVAHVAKADVDILAMGAEQMQQVLLSGGVDGASVLDPIPAIVMSRDPSARILVNGQGAMPDAPGAAICVREKAIAAHAEAIQKLVALHIRATELIHQDPARAARDITAAIGNGLVAVAIIEASLRADLDSYIADPHRMIAATKRMQDYQASIGTLGKKVDVDLFIDTAFYDRASKAP